ncbi:MAG: molecular chaperone DnaJ [Candidatus Competibacteraceae bacterium]|nr:molecular chaperone DnaJ [Candidatus Competibacteraceae bacterium]
MHIPIALIPNSLLIFTFLCWLLVIGVALRHINSKTLSAGFIHVFLGAVVALLLLWRFDVSVTPGLGFHFLGVTVFTLMVGWPLGIIGVSLATLGIVLSQQADLGAWPLNSLLFGALPVFVSYAIYRLVYRYLPRHIFITIFLCAFFGAMLAASVSVFAGVGYLVLSGAYSMAYISETYLPFLPLYLLPEGLLNGFMTTVFIALRPAWLSTFDELTPRG